MDPRAWFASVQPEVLVDVTWGTATGGSSGLSGYTSTAAEAQIVNGRVVRGVRFYSTSGCTCNVYILRDDGGNSHTVVASGSGTHPGGGFATVNLSADYTVPGSGTYRPAMFSSSNGGGYYITNRIYVVNAASGTQTYSADSNSCVLYGYTYVT